MRLDAFGATMSFREIIVDAIEEAQAAREYINDPTDFSPRAVTGRFLCDAYGSQPATFAGAAAFVGSSTLPIEYMCQPYWEENGYDPPVDVPPNFTGGQCEGAPYALTINRVDSLGDPGTSFGGILTGPIARAEVTSTQSEPDPSLLRYNWIYENQAGDSNTGSTVSQVAITFEVDRTDGMPDDCGDLPPTKGPGAVPPPNNPVGSPGGGGIFGDPAPITVNPPTSDPATGNPEITVDTPFGPVTFAPSGPVGGGDDETPSEPVAGAPVPIPGTSGEVDDDPVDDQGRVCIGYRIEISSQRMTAQAFPGSLPERGPEVFGSAQLRYTSVGTTDSVWGDVVRLTGGSTSVIRQDSGVQVVGVSLNVNPDYAPAIATPIYL